MVLELAILANEPVDVHVHQIATVVHDACIELEKVLLELNLQIVKLQLRAQPLTPSEIRE